MTRKKKTNEAELSADERFALYEATVLSPEFEVQFLAERFLDAIGRPPRHLREDFCGTAAIARAFVTKEAERTAIGVDIDRPTLAFAEDKCRQQELHHRLTFRCADVCTLDDAPADIISAQNFSWCGLHERERLLHYFSRCRRALAQGGVLVIDLLGGSAREVAGHQSRRDAGPCVVTFRQKTFDVVSRRAHFAIDFTLGGRTHRDAFQYDWRLWTIPETKDLLREAGFDAADVFFEERDQFGAATSRYRRADSAEGESLFVCYLVAVASSNGAVASRNS